MEDDKKEKAIKSIKRVVSNGVSHANKERKAELQPKIDMADRIFQMGLLFFFLLFFIIIAVVYFVQPG